MARRSKKIPASNSPRYRKFIAERDRALEVILNKSRAMMHDTLRGAFQTVKERIALKYSTAVPDSTHFDSSPWLAMIDEEIKREFHKTISLITGILIRLKAYSYTLSMMGEAEAIGQAMDRTVKVHLTRDDTLEHALTNANGEPIGARVQLAMDRVRRKIGRAHV